MKTSIATVSISGSLESKIRAVADAGFDGVEIFENDLLGFPGTPREVGRIIRDSGMQCTLFQPFRDLEGMPAEQRARAFERMERKFDVMAELGTDLVLLCSNCSPLARSPVEQMSGFPSLVTMTERCLLVDLHAIWSALTAPSARQVSPSGCRD